jgi:IstB-like ATP binding protein
VCCQEVGRRSVLHYASSPACERAGTGQKADASGSAPSRFQNDVHYVSGSPGVGKTHLSVALAEEAIRSGLGAYFITAHDLAADLGRAYREGRLDRRMRVYLAPKVLVIDEVGYLPLDDLGATIFFQLVSARYERGSIILTSNKSYGDWGSIFGDSIIATAILDRLLHHSTSINIRGESYRLKDRRKAGLVPPRGQEGAEAAARSLASDSVTPKTRQKTALGSTPSKAKEAHS